MKVIAYRRVGGGVSIVNPAPRRITELMAEGMTEDQAIAAIQSRSVPSDATNIEVMEQSLLPTREFRNSWDKPGVGTPAVDMPKARRIHAKRISVAIARAIPVLQGRSNEATVDGRTADATRADSDRVAIEALDLSAINAQIVAAARPNDLSAVWPTELDEFR